MTSTAFKSSASPSILREPKPDYFVSNYLREVLKAAAAKQTQPHILSCNLDYSKRATPTCGVPAWFSFEAFSRANPNFKASKEAPTFYVAELNVNTLRAYDAITGDHRLSFEKTSEHCIPVWTAVVLPSVVPATGHPAAPLDVPGARALVEQLVKAMEASLVTVQADAEAQHLTDGFNRRERPCDIVAKNYADALRAGRAWLNAPAHAARDSAPTVDGNAQDASGRELSGKLPVSGPSVKASPPAASAVNRVPAALAEWAGLKDGDEEDGPWSRGYEAARDWVRLQLTAQASAGGVGNKTVPVTSDCG